MIQELSDMVVATWEHNRQQHSAICNTEMPGANKDNEKFKEAPQTKKNGSKDPRHKTRNTA